MAAQEARGCLIEEEAGVEGARPRQDHHEAIEDALGVSDLDLAEVSPIDLSLLAGQCAQSQKRLGACRRTHLGDVAAQLHARARIAARLEHLKETGCAKARVKAQGLFDEDFVGV